MVDSPHERLRCTVLDGREDERSRAAAVAHLVELGTRDSVEVLLELCARPEEPEAILRAAGTGLAALNRSGVPVSEWDLGDLAGPAAEAFFE